MLTAGGQVIVWVSDEGVRLFLGLERPREEKSRWAFIGKVGDAGLTVLGLWLIIERIEEREMGTAAKIKKTWSVTPKTCLIRVDFIITAQVFNTYPKEAIGVTENPLEGLLAVVSPMPSTATPA
ncbi:MAG TPA: hypothetical protein VJT11_01755 [Nitrospiraceae bacterium]|nr:hypothetical protein [Nitrospiraceae bacterium]